MITIDVACGLGSFDEEKELEKLRAAAAPPPEEAEPAAEEQPPAPEGEGEGEGDAEPKEEEPQPEPAQEPIADPNGAIYERVMYLIPYKSSQMLQRIYKSIEKINLVGIGHNEDDSVRMLTTKELSDEEKANRLLDVITGYEFMDAEFRIIVLEGIGGRGWSMHKFYEQN